MRREQIIPQEDQQLIAAIENTKLQLVELPLPDMVDNPNYRQVIRVQDVIINLSEGYFKAIPKRILIHKITGAAMDLNLKVPNLERFKYDIAALVDANGTRKLYETNYYNEEDELVETKQEPKHVNCVQYLTFLSSVQALPQLFTAFIQQYIDDEQAVDPLIFTKL
ncbi:hypothetical protein [Faecalibacter bovis]|uniref:Uncharacterized protein n=1 Tax=Faecalibacter bovis TaxID=2898187 RepID=A0ABX7XE00_9FLAO|nr:hypothetical protein [Faecalibacter bovis]QTV06069.1 hypothetical protein J9309_01590 [Faecalibacter bovis]